MCYKTVIRLPLDQITSKCTFVERAEYSTKKVGYMLQLSLGKRATSRQLQWINCQLDYGGPNTLVHPKSLQRITGYSSSIGITAPTCLLKWLFFDHF